MTEQQRSDLIRAKSKVMLMRHAMQAGNALPHELADAKAALEQVEREIRYPVGPAPQPPKGEQNKAAAPAPLLRERGEAERGFERLFEPEKKHDDVILGKKAEVMRRIHELTKAEAEKSNALALCAPGSNQSGLCAELIAGRADIEKLYDLWYYMHRNNALPPTPEDLMTQKEAEIAKRNDPDRATKLAVNKAALDSYRNIADKARRALRGIGNTSPHKREENIEKLTLKIKSCEAEIKRLVAERENI